ncbi:unnamed protein product [Caenorhabditis sp. 36 PRJEB53466]|nr:unnamed protein product [Caenorhabditis sp. 36 PRJEB53466]
MESSSTSTAQEEPLDLSTGNGNGEEHQQLAKFMETCGLVFQQNLFAWLIKSMTETAVAVTNPSIHSFERESPEKENTCERKEEKSVEEEHESTPSPTQVRRRTSTGKIDRRMVGKMCTRRVEANARERNRVQQLSKMFDSLRVCLPVGDDLKISKLATLKVASAYIGFLGSLLKDSTDEEDEFRKKLQIELESAKTLRK